MGPAVLRISADAMLLGDGVVAGAALDIDADGVIVAAGPVVDATMPAPAQQRHYSGLVVPGAVNAHSHAFQILLRGRSDAARDFRDWVDNYMYRLALSMSAEDLRIGSRLAFAEMLLNGITTVGEFFYVHNAPESDRCQPLGNRNAIAVIESARECGLRVHLLRCLYDRNERRGQKRFYEPYDAALAATTELAEQYAGDAAVTVGIAPHSLHGASAEGIVAAAAWAQRHDQPFQIHIAEEAHDLEFARAHYGTSPGRALEQLGVISERLCVVHGVWLDPEEIELLGGAGALCAYNPISNMALGDGITDIEAMIRAGVMVGLGCDGPCANHQVNIWQEMRFAEWLQRTQKLRMNVIQPAAEAAFDTASANYCFEMGTVNGGRVLGLPVGKLAAGYAADLVAIDIDDLSLLPHHRRDGYALVNNLVNSMAARGAVRDVIVAGQEVVRDGRLVRIDQTALAAESAAWAFASD